MTVGRAEIADVQTGEDVVRLFAEHRLQVVVAAQDSLFPPFIHKMQLHRQTVEPPTPFVVGRAGGQIDQVLRETAFERVDGHVVVVQHDKQVVLVHRGVVQSLERQAACHRAVTDNSHHIAFFIGAAGYIKAQGRRYAVARVSRNERIVFALRRIGKRRQTFELTVRMEAVATAGQNLMRVGLMTYIPNELVVRCVEYIVKRYRQFDSA